MVKTISGYPNAHDNRNAKSNVKSRLGLKSSSSKAGKTSGIVKKVERAGPGQKNEIKLFTKHFDARNKIKSNPKNIKTEQHTKVNKSAKSEIAFYFVHINYEGNVKLLKSHVGKYVMNFFFKSIKSELLGQFYKQR